MRYRRALSWLVLLAPLSCASTASHRSGGDAVPAGAGSEAQAGGPTRLEVTRLRFVRELGRDGRPAGPQVTILPPGAREVHCAFTITGAPPRTAVEVRWTSGGREVLVSRPGEVEGDRELVATLAEDQGLAAGLYRAEVVAGGAVAAAGSFLVEEPPPAGGLGPRVANLTLTAAVEPSGLPAGPPLEQVRGDEPVLYLSLTFSQMPPGRVLEISWFDDATPGAPVASSTFEVSGRGSLAASLAPGGPLEIGPHHVEVSSGGEVLATVPFEVDRPEDRPRREFAPP